MRGRLGVPTALAAILAVAPGVAVAQIGGPDRTVYAPADYSAFAPQTALDMVRRTPGFVLDEGDGSVRGFGGAGGNVLIDGARPSSKAGLLDALGRIPADQVERIEVIRNATTSEAQGQTLVLNVVRRPGEASGTWSAEIERNGNGVTYPRLEASYSRMLGDWRTAIKARAYWEEFPSRTLRLNRDADGTLLSSTVTDLPSTLGEAILSGDASRPLAGGLLNLTGRLGHYNYYFDQPGQSFIGRAPDDMADQMQLNQLDIERWSVELGADWARLYGDWSLKTVGLVNYRDGAESSRQLRETAGGALLSRTVVESTAAPLELVGRITLANTAPGRLRPEFGGEIAYNRFDRTFALAVDDGGGLVPIQVPASNVVVEELRGEAFANLSWTLSPRWTLEGTVAVEASDISVSGDADQSQGFSFFKPAIAVAWRPVDRLQFRLGLRHTVGQLNFDDFAATSDLDDDTTAAGNPDLGPDQTTRYYASLDYRGAGDLAVALEVFHEDRQDVLEQILLPSGAPGLANAGDATYRGIKGSLTLPLDRVLAGARFTAEGEVRDSDFTDPVTGRARALSSIYSPELEAEFRHDPPGLPLSWGLTWEVGYKGDVFLVDEIDALQTDDVLGGFIETTAGGRFKTRLAVRNADTSRSRRTRTFFDPDRSGMVAGTEERFTRSPAFVTLTFTGTF